MQLPFSGRRMPPDISRAPSVNSEVHHFQKSNKHDDKVGYVHTKVVRVSRRPASTKFTAARAITDVKPLVQKFCRNANIASQGVGQLGRTLQCSMRVIDGANERLCLGRSWLDDDIEGLRRAEQSKDTINMAAAGSWWTRT